ncbi:CsiV family protein [Methylophaga sp. OBS3]|uniref:CsiV family protein n=1 Tax=Methylophaga sp. OBS3 TaxID=2991934 RepID=UPI0022547D74|nr:CsiV family protein [Methylophaga sp. OBS3]MCX4190147.1 peptidoglycan binding protein CsiV [Methylophaga sp. OBS3]
MIISKRLSILFLTGLLFSLPAHAQQWYQVELVVFEQLNPSTDEAWPAMPPSSPSVSPQTSSSKVQPSGKQLLSGVAERLRNSAGYRVLTHQSWQQSALGKRASVAVTVSGERLSGMIRVFKSAYLHTELDLWLMDASQAMANDSFQGPRAPNLKQSRRIRSKELHYFDHPRFGAILQLTPIQTPDAVLAAMQGSESYALPD